MTGSNSTNTSHCPYAEEWDWLHTMQLAYILATSVLGILDNVFVLLLFCLHKKACTVAEIYLSNLAAADLLLVSCLPLWAVNVANGFDWPFGPLLCRLVNVGINMNAYSSIYFLALVSVDRYVALVHTMSPWSMRSPSYAKLACLLVWGYGLLLGTPTMEFRSVQFFPQLGVEACYMAYPHDGWRLRYNLTVNIVGFLVPIPIVSFCSYHIISVLRDNQASRMRSTTAAGTERKAAHLVLIVLAIFILCWLPYQVVIFLDTLYHYEVISGCGWVDVLEISTQLATYLGYSNSSLNPFLYVIVGKHFKQRARGVCRQMMCCGKGRKSYHIVNLNSTIKYTDSTKLLDGRKFGPSDVLGRSHYPL
ncbi:B2 bradykinin receptor-like [Oncorhynchus clarkii lewisi]|uniref:B2 bradykinin receptor-like n=1 Tax=Oncorhynchus clarkii lewisi TaxID=490388 RepID=UPI0039B8FEEA